MLYSYGSDYDELHSKRFNKCIAMSRFTKSAAIDDAGDI